MSGKLRAGVIGCGGIAQMMHLPTLAERPDLFEITAVADISEAVLNAVADRYRVAERSRDFRDVATSPNVDAVFVLSSGRHDAALEAAYAAGKHVFVEKPLGFGRPETERLATAAHAARGFTMVGYHKRFDPAYLALCALVKAMPDLRYVEATVLHPDDGAYREHHAILPWREPKRPGPDEAQTNAGARQEAQSADLREGLDATVRPGATLDERAAALMLWQSLIHDINALRGALGEPERVLSSSVWNEGLAQHSLTQFGGGVRVSMSWISLPGVKHYEERLRFVSPNLRATLVFPSPYIRHAPTRLEVERMEGETLVVEDRVVSYDEAFRAEVHHFRESVLAGKAPSITADEAVKDARWIEAIGRSYVAAPARDVH
ncbi:MAG: Gfo/Idh/MocA family oxidoreductase [Vicinamibacteria bacterium]|nr:Gfo/Idh/MocA family oxidoreductase [Vicinamibacteria bacterium]